LPEATVIAVGPGAPDKEGKVVPTSVKAGDHVLLPGWGGNQIKVGEEVRVTDFQRPARLPFDDGIQTGILPFQRLRDSCQNPGVDNLLVVL